MVPLMMNSTCRSVNRFTLPSYVNFLNFESHIDYPFRWEMEALLTNKGMGRGVVKRKRQTLKHNNVYKRFVQRPSCNFVIVWYRSTRSIHNELWVEGNEEDGFV